jgi:hypothetical protein
MHERGRAHCDGACCRRFLRLRGVAGDRVGDVIDKAKIKADVIEMAMTHGRALAAQTTSEEDCISVFAAFVFEETLAHLDSHLSSEPIQERLVKALETIATSLSRVTDLPILRPVGWNDAPGALNRTD